MTAGAPGGRIAITGGGGFIGTHLAERLGADRELVLFDSFRHRAPGSPPPPPRPGVRVIEGDVLDPEALARALDGARVVLHLAAIAGVSNYYSIPLETLEVNVLGTVHALRAAVAAGVETFVYFSTSEVYGPSARDVGEEAPLAIGPTSDRRWVYAASKIAGENFVLRSGERHGFRATCIRPFNVYGPGQAGEGAIGNFCRAAVRGEPLTVYGDGSAIRAWCWVGDLVDAVLAVLETPASAGESINVGNPSEVETTAGLAERVRALAPGATIRRREVERSEVAVRIPRIEKAARLLGFAPKVGLDEGLRRTLDWYREHPGA